jgi:hypothetical protein
LRHPGGLATLSVDIIDAGLVAHIPLRDAKFLLLHGWKISLSFMKVII